MIKQIQQLPFLFCVLSTAWGHSLELSRPQMESDLEQLVEAIQSSWAYYDYRKDTSGFDAEGIKNKILAEIPETRSANQFGYDLWRFLSLMQDGHAHCSLTGYFTTLHEWPFELREVREGIAIVDADDKDALKNGSLLLSVDGVPISELIRRQVQVTVGSTESARRFSAIHRVPNGPTRLGWTEKDSITIEIVSGSGKRSIGLKTRSAPKPWIIEQPIQWRMLNPRIGYLRIPSFAQDYVLQQSYLEEHGKEIEHQWKSLELALADKREKILKAFSEIGSSDALVLDLRDNGGGSDLLAKFLVQYFVSPSDHPIFYHLENVQTEYGRIPDKIKPDPDVKPFGGKLVVLVNAGCMSTTDNFLNYIMCSRPDVRFVGQPNGAASGSIVPIVTLPNSGAVIRCATFRVWNPNKQFIEGNPISITDLVQWTQSDILSGADPDLQMGMKVAEALIAKTEEPNKVVEPTR